MMRRPVGLFCLLAAGCAAAPPPSPVPDPSAAECARIAELAAGGEHKPASDAHTALRGSGTVCTPEVEAAAELSRGRLAEADALLHEARAQRREGDLDAATASLRGALEIYPRYQWAAKLLEDVESERAAEPELRRQVTRHLELARAAEQRQELDDAARLTLLALAGRPAEPGLRSEVATYAERLGLALFSEGALSLAKQLWQGALELGGESPKLTSYLEQVQRRIDSLEQIRAPGQPPG